MSVLSKLYGKVVIKRVVACTEHQIGEGQCGIKRGRGCVDHVFALEKLWEKYLEKDWNLYVAFCGAEENLWKVLQIYGGEGELLEAYHFLLEVRCVCK